MNKHANLITILLAAIVAAIVSYSVAPLGMKTMLTPTQKETTLDRVKRTGVIRCGYITWPPYLIKDLNTGAMSGIAHELIEAIAHEMEVRVDWAEEVGWGNYHEGLNANRYDLMCVPVWQSGTRAKAALLAHPLYYTGLYAFARADDTRFDQNLSAVNQKDVRIVVVEGDITQGVRRTQFPDAQELALAQMADPAQFYLSVATNKADVLFDNFFAYEQYNKAASVKLKPIAESKPIRLFGTSPAVRIGETEWKDALDTVIESLIDTGTVGRIVKKHPGFVEPLPGFATTK
jgi:polar amino acid transport system substrate-binding protein